MLPVYSMIHQALVQRTISYNIMAVKLRISSFQQMALEQLDMNMPPKKVQKWAWNES